MSEQQQLPFGQWAGGLPSDYLECRTMQHTWEYVKVIYVAGTASYEVSHQCKRCTTTRLAYWDNKGVVLATQYKYPPGYLRKESEVGDPSEGTVRDGLRQAYVARVFGKVQK